MILRQRYALIAALFAVSGAGLIFEITLTRLFSLFFKYHYVFTAAFGDQATRDACGFLCLFAYLGIEGRQPCQDEGRSSFSRMNCGEIDLILVNVIWFLFSVPLITAVPALGGLFYATNRMAHGSTGDWRVFWQGFRENFRLSWRWGLVNAVVLLFLGFEMFLVLGIPALATKELFYASIGGSMDRFGYPAWYGYEG